MFIKQKKAKSKKIVIINKLKEINPLFLTFILTISIIWIFFNKFLILGFIFLVLSFLYLFIYYKKYRWLTLLLLIPVCCFLIQMWVFNDHTSANQVLSNEEIVVIKKSNSYYIVQWKHQKFFWSVYNQDFSIGQHLKINGLIEILNFNQNSYNFDFKKYLTIENVYKSLKINSFELVSSKNLKFLFFNWIKNKHFSNLIQFFVFQQSTIKEIKDSLIEINLSYLLNFSGLNIFAFIFLFDKIFKKFLFPNYNKIPIHLFLLLFLYLIDFPLVFSRIVFSRIIKNLFLLFKIKISNFNQNLIVLNLLFIIKPNYIFQDIFCYLIVSLLFFQKKSNFREINFWCKNLIKAVLIFIPLEIFFQYRWNFSTPILNLIISPVISIFYLLTVLLWWVPHINSFWNFLEGSLIEMLKFLKLFTFSWNFGSEPMIIFFVYYLVLFWLLNKTELLKISFFVFIIFNILLFTYSKILLPREAIFMLNVGNGSSFVYINKFKNLVIIYDCGNGPGYGTTNMADFLKKIGINHVDMLFISHFHIDHYNGVDNVKKILHIYKTITNEQENDLVWKIKNINIFGWKLKDMKDINDTSLIILLKTQTRNILLVGDLTKKGEQKLLEMNSFCLMIKNNIIDLLQLGHHGSKTSSSESFLSFINPKNIFISAGLKNNHQFPDSEILDLLKKLKFNFFSTHTKINWKYNLKNNNFYSFK